MEEQEEKHPWERGQGGADEETSRSYEVFVAFLRLGPWRSLLKVYNAVYRAGEGDEPAKNPPRFIQQWSARNNWQERADAFDDWSREQSMASWQAKRFQARDRLIMDFLDPLMDAAISLALGWDVGEYKRTGEVVTYKPKSAYQVQILRDLLSRAGLDETTKAEITHRNGEDPWEEVRAFLKGMKDGTTDMDGADASELADMYFKTTRGGGADPK